MRTPDRRTLHDKELKQGGGAASIVTPPPRTFARAQAPTPGTLDFGRYQGWTIARLARQDPDYLRWLAPTHRGSDFVGRSRPRWRSISAEPTMTERLRGRDKS